MMRENTEMLCSAATELFLILMLMFSVASSARLSVPGRGLPPSVALFQGSSKGFRFFLSWV